MVMELAGPMMWLDMFDENIDQTVLYIFAAVAAINLVLAVALLVLGCIFRGDTPGSSTNFYIAFGGVAIVACVIIQGLDPDYLSAELMKDMCQCYPAVLCFGSVAFVGGLLVRACCTFTFYRTQDPQKVQKQEWKPNMWMLLLLLLEAAPVLVWVMLYDLRGEDAISANTDYVKCTSDEYDWFKLGMSAYHAFLILLAAIFVWPAIYYSKKTVSEIDANMVCVCIYNTLFAVAAGVVVYILYEASPTYMYAIGGGLLLYIVFLTLGLLIVAKLCVAKRSRGDDGY